MTLLLMFITGSPHTRTEGPPVKKIARVPPRGHSKVRWCLWVEAATYDMPGATGCDFGPSGGRPFNREQSHQDGWKQGWLRCVFATSTDSRVRFPGSNV